MTLIDDEKSRGTCNGGPRHGKVITIAETYAACVEQPIHRLMWAIMASINYIGLGADVSNAFAEATPTERPFLHGSRRPIHRLVGQLPRQSTHP